MSGHTRDVLLVAVGGAAGAVMRHLVGRLLGPASDNAIPWHTLFVNVTGAFVLGLLVTFAARQGSPDWWRPLLGVGVLGGYTTFSTFSLELAELALGGSLPVAAAYLVLSGLAAVGGALVGIMAGRAMA